MKRTGFVALAVAALAQVALGQDAAPRHPLLARFDANGDGRITRAEVTAAAAKTIADADANHDGVLSVQEHTDFQAAERFRALDVNQDGGVSLEEFSASRAGGFGRGFGGRDQDGDGNLSVDELSGMIGRLFEVADADHDGELTQDELASAPMGRGGRGGGQGGDQGRGGRGDPAELFARLDADQSGSLSQDELEAMMSRFGRGGRGGGRGEGRGGEGQGSGEGRIY